MPSHKSHRNIQHTPIGDKEDVARILFSPSHIDNGKVGSTAFALQHLRSGAEDDISVIRLLKVDVDNLEKIVSFMKPRTEGDSLYGYCTLSVRGIRDIANILKQDDIDGYLEVKDTCTRNNKFHTSIYIYLNGQRVDADCVEPEVFYIQSLLANICSEPIPFSSSEDGSTK